jgi:hypothetical protein
VSKDRPPRGTHTREKRPPRAKPNKGEKIGHEEPGTVLRGPPIAVTCACGHRHSLRYGDVWTCPDCGRVWDTSDIPREEYEAIRRITLRFRVLPVALGLLVATLALFFVLTGNSGAVFVLLPLALIGWFSYLRGAHRRRYRAALADRQRWRLEGR